MGPTGPNSPEDQPMTRRLMALALLALPPTAAAQDKAAEPAKAQRAVYPVAHGDAKTLAEALSKHFKGELEVSALTTDAGSVLLVSGPAAGEAVKLLGLLDRAPKTVAVEVVVAEVTVKKVDDAKRPPDPLDSENAAEVLTRLEELA